MPELPDITVYVDALRARVVGETLLEVRITTPFLLRTVDPPLREVAGKSVRRVRRIHKRIALSMEDDIHIVIHLMIAGRLHWLANGKRIPKTVLAVFEFAAGALTLTEAGSKKRASMHVVRGEEALKQFERGGLEPLEMTEAQFRERLRSENHTIKRSLTDPRMFSGIGNAYSDEILHRARMSPVKLTSRMSDEEIGRTFGATRAVLTEWIERMSQQAGDAFPEKVTAFRPEMAVHGKYLKACPECGTSVQRIRYADNETNYCPRCQTEGKLLADRSLSRLLKQDWPRSIEEIE